VIAQDARAPRFYAGIFRRWKNSVWSRKESENRPLANSDRTSTSLAEWLRMAHLLLDGKTVASAGELSNSPQE
jgi:hypothetical protein